MTRPLRALPALLLAATAALAAPSGQTVQTGPQPVSPAPGALGRT